MPTLGPSSKSYAISGLQARKFILNKNIAEAMRGLTKAEIHQLEMLAGERHFRGATLCRCSTLEGSNVSKLFHDR